jgi:hypothetical protein
MTATPDYRKLVSRNCQFDGEERHYCGLAALCVVPECGALVVLLDGGAGR